MTVEATTITYHSPHPDIRGIGLEIECGMEHNGTDYQDVKIDRDVTVYVPDDQRRRNWIPNTEVKIRIQATEWPTWSRRIVELWQRGRITQNSTCGNHVHVALSERALHAVAHRHFLRWFHQRYLARWGNNYKYTARLKYSYCRWDEPPTHAIQHRMKRRGERVPGSTRYRAINWHAVHEYGTVEFRLLPHAGNSEEYIHAVDWLLHTLGEYLRRELDVPRPQQLSLPFEFEQLEQFK